MRTFDEFNSHGEPCPICGTHDNKPPVLIGISGTEDGHIMEAVQVHLECLELKAYRKDGEIIFGMKTKDRTSKKSK